MNRAQGPGLYKSEVVLVKFIDLTELMINDFAHRAPGKIPQTSPFTPQKKRKIPQTSPFTPQKRNDFLSKRLVKGPWYLPGVSDGMWVRC